MTQHEYVFVAISIILGLAITRLLHIVALLIRAHSYVEFHWATALWGLCVMAYALQMWWVGWGLRDLGEWTFANFSILTLGSICVYGAAELAMPMPDGDGTTDFLKHSQGLGRLSALSLLLYFAIGPYMNIIMFENDILPSLVLPLLGALLMALIMAMPKMFPWLSIAFAIYTAGIISVTT